MDISKAEANVILGYFLFQALSSVGMSVAYVMCCKFVHLSLHVSCVEFYSLSSQYSFLQARFLCPDEVKIKELVNLLKEKKIGIVAHFYMDPEVQGILTAAQKLWPHIHISDSLVMADSAVAMAKAGCEFIAVLGVDFMSENVRAILDQAGFTEV